MNVTSTIDVDVDPMTAFKVFTDEFDQWWGNGPIDAWDSSRCIGRRQKRFALCRRPPRAYSSKLSNDNDLTTPTRANAAEG